MLQTEPAQKNNSQAMTTSCKALKSGNLEQQLPFIALALFVDGSLKMSGDHCLCFGDRNSASVCEAKATTSADLSREAVCLTWTC